MRGVGDHGTKEAGVGPCQTAEFVDEKGAVAEAASTAAAVLGLLILMCHIVAI